MRKPTKAEMDLVSKLRALNMADANIEEVCGFKLPTPNQQRTITMTPTQAKELLPIIQAFAEGKELQYRHKSDLEQPWCNIKAPGFCTENEYRIKPEPINLSSKLVQDKDRKIDALMLKIAALSNMPKSPHSTIQFRYNVFSIINGMFSGYGTNFNPEEDIDIAINIVRDVYKKTENG